MGTAGKTVVGLDIEAAVTNLAPGVVRDGEVVDVDMLATALRKLFSDHKLTHRVRIGVANQRIVMRMLDLPPIKDPKQIATAVRFQAQEHIPMPLEQAVLEHYVLGPVETAEGARTRVVLVAARRDLIERWLEATRRAGLRPQGIDLSAFAMIRALHRPGMVGATLLMNVGGMTNLAVAVGTTCVFTRAVPQGIESLAGELAERRQLTLDHAHAWLKHVGLVTPTEDIDGDDEIVLEARTVLSDGVRRIGDEIRNSLDFYRMQSGAGDVERSVLTGPAVAIPGFVDQLGQQVGLELEIGLVAESRPGALGGIDAGRLAIAAGLAVEEVSE
jgi:type IV pilus assembly protein PilM